MTTQFAPDPHSWHVTLVESSDELDRLKNDPGIDVIDRLDQQWRDLQHTLPAPPEAALTEPSRWYFYPWRRTIVHLLGPIGFQTLRSDRNRNKITAEEQQRLRRLSIGVVGLSVGHAIAHTLALEGLCREIRLADFDEIELSNLNRIPGTVFDLGVNKAIVAARRIAEIDPYIDVHIEPSGLSIETADRFMDGLDIVIEECDSFDVKLATREAARRHRLPLVMETSDRGLLDVERYDLEPERPLFHGLLGDTKPAELMGLSTHDKVPYILRVLEPRELSAMMAASMTEVDETLSTWPQLGGDINLGAATVAAAVRKLGLGQHVPSGRVRIDLGEHLDALTQPPVPATLDVGEQAPTDPEPAPDEPRQAVVHAARLAPSGGNTQPWIFAADDDALDIHLDPAQTSTLDVAFRGSYVAIGAALFNARVAAARHGILGGAEIFPRGLDQGPVATLRFTDGSDPELASLYEPMLSRVSNRRLTEYRPLPHGAPQALADAARAEGAHAHVVTDRERLRDLAELFGESDRLRYLTPHLHEELMRELRWPGSESVDWGLDVRTLELDPSDLAKLDVAQRADVMSVLAEQDLGRALGESTRDRLLGSSALLVVTINDADPGAYVRGGQAVERTWIQAEQLGLSVQVISPLFIYAVSDHDYEELSARYRDQLRELREKFDHLTGIDDQTIAITMRIGYAPGISARSQRLPAERTVRIR
ncbi:Rv1355c family protein [Actinobacteria bacterium YIM 96077]|uniref:Rv1355c family protein n=1 Tax=Phytoactinopolyspora halophila TaxID=1981511 RepID=A0A329QEU8_9ACTN|nr:Rv1355c family protein [Phytoactinopolyspora halophila]AYY14096.1 Rv1355c family protein [Actinobacteria bacterium YIM 96077]RAW11003.1 Rv1355c family protein [Phytoactinopolyspora halophila]